MRSIRKIFEIELPIIQAPMAGVQGSALALAVAGAGGLGSLPCALLSAEATQLELEALARGTSQPFNVNFFCHAPPAADPTRDAEWRRALKPYYDELGLDVGAAPAGATRQPFSHVIADVVEPFEPAVVSFHFGLPSDDLLERVRSWGSTILSSATTVDEARWLEARGVDAIIAQGAEAGGHSGMFLSQDPTTQLGTFALIPQVVRAVRVPVIAAGGIADAGGVRAALALGAAGVQVGTAYLLCPEATTGPVHRQALASSAAHHTALTNVFTGRPARSIVNRLVRELGPMSPLAPPFPLAAALTGPLRAKAEQAGNGDFSPLWSGQNATGCRNIPAADLTRDLGSAAD